MPALIISDVLERVGTRGLIGAQGAGGAGGLDGAAAGDGEIGGMALLSAPLSPRTGTKFGDTITTSRTTTGGQGGEGGIGGEGGAPVFLEGTTTEIGYSTALGRFVYETYRRFGDGGDGGVGGDGGTGGIATSIVRDVTLKLGQAGTAADNVAVTSTAYGGGGGQGGTGGDGGSVDAPLNWTGSRTFYGQTASGWAYGGTETQDVGTGGDGGARGDGGRGATGEAAISGLTLATRSATVSLHAFASGGFGGDGGDQSRSPEGRDVYGRPGWGAPSADAAIGGRGGDGGDGWARLAHVVASHQDAALLDLRVAAKGGGGGEGGGASRPEDGAGADFQLASYGPLYPIGSYQVGTYTRTPGSGSDGGDGGDGGEALARFADNRFTFGAGADTARITLSAIGGGGGHGGRGLRYDDYTARPPQSYTVQSIDPVTGNTVSLLVTDSGIPETADGAAGASGTARIELLNNRITLGDGSDSFALSLEAGTYTAGNYSQVIAALSAANLVASGNRFDGGLGADTLDLAGVAGGSGVVVDTKAGKLTIGGVAIGNISGFETIRGTSGADRFVDGAGDQGYIGGAARDTFLFGLNHGDDTLGLPSFGFLETDDRIQLKGFGPAFNSFAEVMAATHDILDGNGNYTGEGCVIDTPDGGSITLTYIAKGQLEASQFLFG